MSDIPLEVQAQRESGLGLELTELELLANNGDPNDAGDPAAAGVAVDGAIWATYSVRPTGGNAQFRIWLLWAGETVWDAVEESEKDVSINRTNRPRVAGASRMYVQWYGGSATSVTIKYGPATGVYVAPSS